MLKKLLIMLVMLSSQANAAAIADLAAPSKIEKLFQAEAEGLEFKVYNEGGVMAFAVIAAHEKYNLHPVLAKNKVQGLATVSQISEGYTNIAIVNGGYFSRGNLIGITKIDGNIVSNDYFYRSAVGIFPDGKTIFGRVRFDGKITYKGQEMPININSERNENRAVLYTEYYGARTGTNDYGTEIELTSGVISQIYKSGNNKIEPGKQILSLHGLAAEMFEEAALGDEVEISEEILSDDANFNEVPDVLGAGPRLVANGEIFVTADAEEFPADIRLGRAPRSAVGVTKWGDYILAVADGRQAHSKGCTLQEWAEILIREFGAVDAINLDGGGSSELIVKGKIVNSPSDGKERLIGNALAIVPKQN